MNDEIFDEESGYTPEVIKNESDVTQNETENTEVVIQNSNSPFGPFGAGFPDGFGIGIGGGVNPFGYPGNQGYPGSTQISQANTGFKNLRWYFLSNMRNFISELYVEIGLVQKVVGLPVDDALRGGIEIKSKQLKEEEIDQLLQSIDQNDDINTVGWGEKWNRLYGGAGILIFTDQDPEEPLDLEAIDENTPVEFRAVDMWELFYDKNITEGWDPVNDADEFQFYSYYGEKIHKSRVMRLKGLEAPSFLRPRLRGWGFSVVEALIRPLNQYLKATDLAFEVTDEFKVDIYKIKDYVNTLMSPGGEEVVAKRVNFGNWQKNFQNALVMDTEDEWDHKQLSFAGLAEMAAENRIQIASELGMPLTKIFGISAAGFNSGEDDIEVYNSMVESTIRNKIKYPILRIVQIRCKKLFGFIPDDLQISFKPLRMLSSEQEQNIKTQKAQALLTAFQAGVITPKQYQDAANKGNLFDIKLEGEIDLSDQDGYLDDKVGGNSKRKAPQGEDEGANRLDSRQSKAAKKSNSASFDKASYEADGGDSWINPRRRLFFDTPANKDLWLKAAEASEAALGQIRWQFQVWWYMKHGGNFG